MCQTRGEKPGLPKKAPRLPLGSLHNIVLNQKANKPPANGKLSKQQRLMEEIYKSKTSKPLEKLYRDSRAQEQQSLEIQQLGQLQNKLEDLDIGGKSDSL